MFKMEDADMGEEYGDFSSKTEDIDMDDYGGYGSYRMMAFWNLEDFPIPQSAELGSIGPRIRKALALMGFCGCVDINGYAEHLNYDLDKLCKAGIWWSPSMRPAYMPKGMIVHAHATTRNREQVILFVIANQIRGSELERVQRCLKSRGCTVIFVDDPLKQCLFQSAESIFDCTRFVGAEQRVSRSGLDFFSGEKPIGPKRSQELLAEVKQVLDSGGYSDDYVDYVSNLCQVIATGKKLILKDIIGCIRSFSPIDDDLFRIIDKVLCERGFRVNFFYTKDTTKGRSPVDCVDLPPLVVEPATCDSHSDSISDSRKIENFSEPITPVETVLFWDVVDCPFPHCPPDEIYDIIDKAVSTGGSGGEMTIWAYVDENNEPWTGDQYLRNKTWNSRIYFLPGGDDKASRLLRMLNDGHLWKMDMVSAACDVDSDYTAFVNVIVV